LPITHRQTVISLSRVQVRDGAEADTVTEPPWPRAPDRELDRLSRNLAFIARLVDAGVGFIAVGNPHANKLTIHILAAVTQHEREMIAERTRRRCRRRRPKARGWGGMGRSG
jgi:DNA invertase Pin-like site-specific DNA recombinase